MTRNTGNPLDLEAGDVLEGTVLRWDRDKGYGFVGKGGAYPGVFLHVHDVRWAATPRKGDRVAAVVARQADGRWCLTDAVLLEAAPLEPQV